MKKSFFKRPRFRFVWATSISVTCTVMFMIFLVRKYLNHSIAIYFFIAAAIFLILYLLLSVVFSLTYGSYLTTEDLEKEKGIEVVKEIKFHELYVIKLLDGRYYILSFEHLNLEDRSRIDLILGEIHYVNSNGYMRPFKFKW